MLTTRGFSGRGRPGQEIATRIPPGQHLTTDFPVLTAGPTQRTSLERWSFSLEQSGKTLLDLTCGGVSRWSESSFDIQPTGRREMPNKLNQRARPR